MNSKGRYIDEGTLVSWFPSAEESCHLHLAAESDDLPFALRSRARQQTSYDRMRESLTHIDVCHCVPSFFSILLLLDDVLSRVWSDCPLRTATSNDSSVSMQRRIAQVAVAVNGIAEANIVGSHLGMLK